MLFVMAILGCGDGDMQCTQARIEPVQYTSIQACQEAMPAALIRNSDIDYPNIAAACQQRGASMASKGGKAKKG